ncbi:acetyltransferase, ribosomal protein N-acetylase [Halovivax ruber XH-70]|uniref:Acetyltransferase, ribosomal protein N-acetylase n=1 Tax=Halovivax ruber (strain DSM 18193 / JCM 13892 / XH-70) TaxID=797302 RepID=L0IBK4_HALRX|nr:GNAT family protein [Halovivax ruber]AGB16945.1 acetyltransferase, ribosomal protein N-acetylase [Halovivax ruber XH-70]
MPGPPFCSGEQVTLHPIQREDSRFCQELLNEPRVRRRIASTDPITAAAERDWIESQDEQDGFNFLICRDDAPTDGDDPLGLDSVDEPEPVGTIGLTPAHEVWGTAEIGYAIAPEYWGNGYATEALSLVCQYAFDERRIAKLHAETFATNPASARVLTKVGFEKEGSFRNEAFVDGARVNVIRYGLLAEEWDENGATR